MVSTPGQITDDTPSLPMTQTTVNKPSAMKSISLFTNIFDVKKRTAMHSVGATKCNTEPLNLDVACGKLNRERKYNITKQIQRKLYTWITRHPQVVQSLIFNDCLKMIFDDHTEPKMVPKCLL